MSRLFICYARADEQLARRLYRDLRFAGLDPWLDKINLQAGDDWRRRISLEIRRCKYFLALLSNHSVSKRGFVQKELRLALETLDEIPIDERFLIPIRLEVCEPQHERLRDLHWFDLFPSYEDSLATLLQTLREGERHTSRFYYDSGVEVSEAIDQWDQARQIDYIRSVLWPEVRLRADREYENINLPYKPEVILETAAEKLRGVATRFGFLEACNHFLDMSESGPT